MKKEYIEPSVKAIEIRVATILAGSDVDTKGDYDGDVHTAGLDLDFEEEEDY